MAEMIERVRVTNSPQPAARRGWPVLDQDELGVVEVTEHDSVRFDQCLDAADDHA